MAITKKPTNSLKIFLSSIVLLLLAVLLIALSKFVYCHTVTICDSRPTMSPEMKANQIEIQYEYAIQDINAKRYNIAKQRFEYIIYLDPEYLDAQEKLSEVETILNLTPTPKLGN
jgi:hypothetical protein